MQDYLSLIGSTEPQQKGKNMTATKLTAGDSVNFAEPKDNVGLNDDACVQCGRKVGNKGWWVEIINGGDIRLQDGTEHDIANDAGYMGCWAVGSECAKSFDSQVLFKRNS